jgi:hypothetical protein
VTCSSCTFARTGRIPRWSCPADTRRCRRSSRRCRWPGRTGRPSPRRYRPSCCCWSYRWSCCRRRIHPRADRPASRRDPRGLRRKSSKSLPMTMPWPRCHSRHPGTSGRLPCSRCTAPPHFRIRCRRTPLGNCRSSRNSRCTTHRSPAIRRCFPSRRSPQALRSTNRWNRQTKTRTSCCLRGGRPRPPQRPSRCRREERQRPRAGALGSPRRRRIPQSRKTARPPAARSAYEHPFDPARPRAAMTQTREYVAAAALPRWPARVDEKETLMVSSWDTI